jgi:D-glycero-alpha-D-manno-heptose-7-phosphate kinase
MRINALAPIRICDNGGWTDTWFARHGRVFNIAVSPCVEVRVTAGPPGPGEPPGVVLHAPDYGERYTVRPPPAPWGPHPLLEAAIASMEAPAHLRVDVHVRSDVPAGAGTGTSAAVAVALVGALDRLRGGRMTRHQVAMAAHRVETEWLGRQSGIQDQIASAYGGVNDIEIVAFPEARVASLDLSAALRGELERRLALVYLGRSHDSSALHETVIRRLEDAGPDEPAFRALRGAAVRSRDALLAGDFSALGAAMVANTEAQAALHPDLVGERARRVIALIRGHGVLGWKVNGAGGDGGSITLLCDPGAGPRETVLRAAEQEDPAFRSIPVSLWRPGLRVWKGDERSARARGGGTPWVERSSAGEC